MKSSAVCYRALSSGVVTAGLGLACVGCASSGLEGSAAPAGSPSGTGGSLAGGRDLGGSPSSTGGSPAGGSSVGGSPNGTGGSPAGGRNLGGSPPSGAVACPTPTQALITDFAYPYDGGATDSANITFGDFTTTFSGGTFFYPTTAMVSDMSASNWDISGTVEDYSGMGLYFNACALVDASAYRGISFTIWGTINSPTPNTLTMGVSTAADTIAYSWFVTQDAGAAAPNFGTCIPASSNRYDGTCGDPQRTFTITPTPTTVTMLWADFTGGKPAATVDPAQITAIYWYFPWSGSGQAPYTVDVMLDNLSFVE